MKNDNLYLTEQVAVPKQLIEDIRHTLVSLGGLEAFDGASEHIVRYGNYQGDIHDLPEIYNKKVTVPLDEIIKLDFEDLIKKIDKAIT